MGDEGRRHAGYQMLAFRQQGTDRVYIAAHIFGILRTYLGAFAAIDTFPVNDLCLVLFYFYGFYRTISYALIAIFAVGLLKL